MALLAAAFLFWTPSQAPPSARDSGSEAGVARTTLAPLPPPITASPPTAAEVAQVVHAVWREQAVSPDISEFWHADNAGIYLAGRKAGRRLHHIWDRGEGNVLDALRRAVQSVQRERGRESAVLEMFFASDRRSFDPANASDRRAFASPSERGVRGLELRWRDRTKSYSPTLMLARNRKPEKQLRLALKEWSISDAEFVEAGALLTMGGPQYLVQIDAGGGSASGIAMYRGNELIGLEAVTKTSTQRLTDRSVDWMKRATGDDGRFEYKYWPSPQKSSTANNMIRQWMASHALVKLARASGRDEDWDRATRNIEHNLVQYYREEQKDGETLGLIAFNEKVKLGAVGLAALVMAEHRDRLRWQSQYDALNRTVDALWHEDGHFDTFYRKPATTREQPNFYPGEALLMWAHRYVETRDDELLARFMKSFEYYRAWHLDERNRNPAFVPWHVRAYVVVWRVTKDPELAKFVFEMSDWLLTMQEWSPSHPDFLGRFYDPERKRFGKPHASATGVYLEGYIEALRLARALGDDERDVRYRKAIVGGLRSLMQLQFVDAVDLFYVRDNRLVRGGIRTTVYDNEIRCDNVQHGLMAMFDILSEFSEADYQIQ